MKKADNCRKYATKGENEKKDQVGTKQSEKDQVKPNCSTTRASREQVEGKSKAVATRGTIKIEII